MKKHIGKSLRKNTSRIKGTYYIITQRKEFFRQRISEFSSTKMKTFDIEILITYRNCDRETRQSVRKRIKELETI